MENVTGEEESVEAQKFTRGPPPVAKGRGSTDTHFHLAGIPEISLRVVRRIALTCLRAGAAVPFYVYRGAHNVLLKKSGVNPDGGC